MNNFYYRTANKADASAIAKLFVENVDESYITASEVIWDRATPEGRWKPDLFNTVAQEIELSADDNSKIILLFFLEQRLVGYTFSVIKPMGSAEVEDFVVAADCRGLGLGKAINEITAEHLRQAGCTNLFMEVGQNNERMKRFVAKDGMQETSTRYWKRI